MSTNAIIGIVNDDDSVSSIYLHCDGYISHAGVILFNYFNTQQKARELIDHGDMSALDKNIDPDSNTEHSFTNPQPEVCIFYHRDRGETLSINKDINQKAFLSKNEYRLVYLFKDNQWYMNYDTNDLIKLETVMRNNDLLPNEKETKQPTQSLNIVGTVIEKPTIKNDGNTHEVLLEISGLLVCDIVKKQNPARVAFYKQLNKNDTVAAVVYKGQNDKWYVKNIEQLNF